MNKVLFFNESDKCKLQKEVNAELKIKNRLLKLILDNPDHKLTSTERNKLINRYRDQIALLESIQNISNTVKNRSDIQRLNSMIDYYQNLA